MPHSYPRGGAAANRLPGRAISAAPQVSGSPVGPIQCRHHGCVRLVPLRARCPRRSEQGRPFDTASAHHPQPAGRGGPHGGERGHQRCGRPQLPSGGVPAAWRSVSVLKPAGGSSFGGDFLVSACDGKTLEVALVDVAGKGVDAGTRALLLSGAFGGLLGSVPQEAFLSSCNAYLRRGEMMEGFVTAVHLALDLTTGEYVVTSAGHPPAAHLAATSGTWRITQARGIVLGVVADLRLVPERGVLRPGDALMLYTDGLVEAPGQDIDYGTDRLLGEADRLVLSRVRAGAADLVRGRPTGGGDRAAPLHRPGW